MRKFEIELGDDVVKMLERLSQETDLPFDALILEAVISFYNNDPNMKTEQFRLVSRRFLQEANTLLAKGELQQASEKFWGAAALMLKAVAHKRGEELRSHGELYKFATQLSTEQNDRELLRLWCVARDLHQNFYENWLPRETIEKHAYDVNILVELLEKLL